MSNGFNDFIRVRQPEVVVRQFAPKPVPNAFHAALPETTEISVASIIMDKPSTKIVRLFFKENLAAILSDEQRLFGV